MRNGYGRFQRKVVTASATINLARLIPTAGFFQERLLSICTLNYGSQLQWKCASLITSESDPAPSGPRIENEWNII